MHFQAHEFVLLTRSTRILTWFLIFTNLAAWSSVREPAQVFTLLETIYAAFDEIANRRKVFKVETVGDCYGEIEKVSFE